ncbi:MAG: hypothetical protein V1928_03545 [Parcubacteria group bacterium]
MVKTLKEIQSKFKSKLAGFLRFVGFCFKRKTLKVLKTSFIIFVLIFTVAMSVGIQVHAEDNFTPNDPGAQFSSDPNASTAPAKKTAPAPAAAQNTPDTGGTTSKIMDFLNRVLFAIAYFLGTLAMTLFSYVVLISSYNDFVTSEAVNKGWVLIRDLCNMFFVVILLIIAFAQILHVEKYSMKTLLPKVLIAAVLVNFSKLVCGLLIDFAQVIMMTFVNGYQATAGANLVVGLGFTKLLKMSAKSTTSSVDPGYSNADIFLTLAMGVVFLVLVIVVTFLILVLLTVRIVTLWILVVLSPFAFLLSDLPFGQSYATEWWKKFGEQVVIGPFLAFFLWLSLLIMSNPDQMITPDIKKAQEDITKSTGGAKQESMQLDNLAQFFIGLAMLLASFEMAQRMGGATAKWAGKVSGMSKSVGKKLGKFAGRTAYKVTGAKAVVKRGQAVYGGFMAKQKEKTAKKMEKWTGVGENVFAGKEAVVKKGKQAVRGGFELGKGVVKKVGLGVIGPFSKKAEEAWSGAGAWKGMATRVKYAGKMETVGNDKIKQAHRDKKMKDANDLLASHEIKSPEQLRELLGNKSASKDMRRAAALKLADKGMFNDKKDEKGNVIKSAAEYAQDAKDLLKGDRASSSAFGDALEKKQMYLAYHLADDKGKDVLSTKLNNGELDLRKQDANSDKDLEWMKFAHDAVGGKSFGKIMTDRASYGGQTEKNIKETVNKMASSGSTSILAQEQHVKDLKHAMDNPNATPADIEKAKEDHKKASEGLIGFSHSVASITGNAELAFTKKDVFDSAGFQKYIQGATPIQISNLINAKNEIAQYITPDKMSRMAAEGGEGPNQFNEVSAEMLKMAQDTSKGMEKLKEQMENKLQALLSSERSRDAMEGDIRGKIEAVVANVRATKDVAAKAEADRVMREQNKKISDAAIAQANKELQEKEDKESKDLRALLSKTTV